MRTLALGLLLMLAVAASAPVGAAEPDPAAATVEAFHGALLETMKAAKALGPMGRYRKLEPAVEGAFDLATMTRFAVGPTWSQMTGAQQQALTGAFTRLSVASYAHNFDGWSGEAFVTDGVTARGPDKVVQTRIVRSGAAPVSLLYRMRESGGAWKIIDVYYNGVSQLTTRRSDFTAPLASGGAAALVAHLNSSSDSQLR